MQTGLAIMLASFAVAATGDIPKLRQAFDNPPPSARPWVYWYFMDGNLTREGLTADLEAMNTAGIGGAIFLEVDIGIPRGPVHFMSEEWQGLFAHAVSEAERLGIEIALGTGPGWTGSGGPWITPENSMQHLVGSETTASGPSRFDAILPRPAPREPFFGLGSLTPEMVEQWKNYYVDEVVLAYPAPVDDTRIPDSDEKALYHRAPFSSQPGVKPFLPALAEPSPLPAGASIDPASVLDITALMGADGRLAWDVPEGSWTILRLGRTITGQGTRPAPAPGLGFESNKLDAAALDTHFEAFIGRLLEKTAPSKQPGRGLTTIHFDSWEMSSQNWTPGFRELFKERRGYDPLPYLPAYLGRVTGGAAMAERFLWDVRQTSQELVIENHVRRLRTLALEHGLSFFSAEGYDMNPCADMGLSRIADVPMCEFWSKGVGFDTNFSAHEAVSTAHTCGRSIVGAEAFTAGPGDDWRQHPASMKAQGDWAFCTGVNRFTFHRLQHQPWLDRFPGMTMGPYGVFWDRTQTFWPMVHAYHTYLSRCQHLLRQGLAVADILYLLPEGAPQVFRPPTSATQEGDFPDRRGYNFDGCDPDVLIERASVQDGRVAFPDGMSYRLLVLPRFDTMRPALLRKIEELVNAGATVIGAPPRKSPSLENYPVCDQEVAELSSAIWGDDAGQDVCFIGAGKVIRDRFEAPSGELYPDYARTAAILMEMGVSEDFTSDADMRYTHRSLDGKDLYFVGNRTQDKMTAQCGFRVSGRQPELWDPMTGEQRPLPEWRVESGHVIIPLTFEPGQSFFVVFPESTPSPAMGGNMPTLDTLMEVAGPWNVAFEPRWGGPAAVVFDTLQDWRDRPEPGIQHYSGRAVYRVIFDSPREMDACYIDLGAACNMASVSLNGRDLGVAWCAPWRLAIPAGLMRAQDNTLEITVANLWINRLIADSGLPETERLTWTTRNPYTPESPLQPSGLIGPVRLLRETGM